MNFTVFAVVMIAIIVILIIFLQQVIKIESQEYEVDTNTFMYDAENNPVETTEKGILKMQWDGNYYLSIGKEEKYKIGNQAITHNLQTSETNIYGNIFEVKEDGTVEKMNNQNTVEQYYEDRFFKLADRKYLITGDTILNDTGSLSTSKYLIITIDKAGNTFIQNNELSAKTIKPMIIKTNSFEFDVANEKLIYPNLEIDLKKIIGSTNEYKESIKTAEKEENTAENNEVEEQQNQGQTNNQQTTQGNIQNNNGGQQTIASGGTGTIQNEQTIINNNNNYNNGNNNTNNNSNNSINNDINNNNNYDNNNTEDEEMEKELEKSINILNIESTSTTIKVNYRIVDPENKYQVVYLTVDGDQSKTIALDKSKTSYTLSNLTPNTDYQIMLASREINSEGEVQQNIEDISKIRTQQNNTKLMIQKVTSKEITVNLQLDSNYVFDTAQISLYSDGVKKETKTIDIEKSVTTGGWTTNFKYQTGGEIIVKIENAVYNGSKIDTDIQAKFKNY